MDLERYTGFHQEACLRDGELLEAPCLEWEAPGAGEGRGKEVHRNHMLTTNIDHAPHAEHRPLSSDQNILKPLFSCSLHCSRRIHTYRNTWGLVSVKEKN